MDQNKYINKVKDSTHFLKEWHNDAPDICIVLGSGLSEAVPGISNMKSIKFTDIPGFKGAGVAGHAGDLRVGTVESTLPNAKKKAGKLPFTWEKPRI